jgi:hypothetical protein
VAFSFIILYAPQTTALDILLSLISVFLPDSPVEAKFLNENDKLIAIERLRMNQMGVMSRTWKWDHLKESFLDLKTWFWFALIISIS